MGFESALKKLAEKWPEKFTYWHGQYPYIWVSNREIFIDQITQDSIDEILGLIGWLAWVEYDEEFKMWYGIGLRLSDGFKFITREHKEKPAAYQHILTSVVERECQ
jgi:hypothetical protein